MTTARRHDQYHAGCATITSAADTTAVAASGTNHSARQGRGAKVAAGSSRRIRRRSSGAEGGAGGASRRVIGDSCRREGYGIGSFGTVGYVSVTYGTVVTL